MSAVTLVEYVYEKALYETDEGHLDWEVRKYPIVKKTAKRVFFDRGHGRTKVIDRAELEQAGSVWIRDLGGYHVYANEADAQPNRGETREERVSRLRAEMADAHPDRGGTSETFRAAHARYVRAKGAAR